MRGSDVRVLRKMDVRCVIFKLCLFQILVAWCSAKNIQHDSILSVELPTNVGTDVQGSIRNLVHNGIYSHRHLDMSKAQVTTPVKVTRDGALISRTLEHDHGHGHSRSRRDLHLKDHTMDHVLHYNVTVDGRDLRLDLRPSVTFITPAMVIERHSTSGRSRHRPLEAATGCHYTGSIRGQTGSIVALSACDGLAGMLRTEQGEYWIEPSDQKPTNSSEGRPHVIYKRSAVDKVAAWHRSKRSVDANYRFNNNPVRRSYSNDREQKYSRSSNRRYDNKEIQDRRRREYLEARRKKLEDLRRNPSEYRRYFQRQRELKARLVNRTSTQSHSSSGSTSNSIELSRSLDINPRNRTRNTNNKNHNRRRNKGRRRRRRQDKNCATKQPPYLWEKKNYDKKKAAERYRNKNHRRYPHHHQLSHYPDFEETRRSTRSVSKPRHVEVLLVADESMTNFHEEGSLETYLLTIMNMVSSLYMDPSIGNYIKVVVVKIILVEEMHSAPELNVSTNADSTLSSFCRWQHQLNPDDDANPHHHDVAILVTRQDICSKIDTPCSTLGVAHVAGMCKPDRSCSVNEDNGIMLAHTITHELGHNFGLYHDTEKIGCHRREGTTLHIMTPIFEADTVQVAWSRCSKRDVTNFLDTGSGECLGDTPSQEDYKYPEVQAGVTFDAATQCHLQFGAEAEVCANPAELCEYLWCVVNGTCKTMLRPAAPGTTCGENMWCQKQKCVPREPKPEPRDGGWGDWGEWSECSRTCGAGVSTQTRLCDNPEPSNNGKYCIGERSRYKICNQNPCPIGEPSFREVQCQHYRNDTRTDWVPYFDHDKPCELMCVPRNGNDVETLGGFLADGTPCRQTDDARDMCIEGVCHKVGCDWVVDSDAEEDACGVCGGDGTQCKTVRGIYDKGTTKQSGFSEVAVIPAGSRNVNIQEKVNPGNYISIRSAKSKKLYIHGTARNESQTEYFVAGSQATYERDRDWEKVRIPGPIKEDIRVYQHLYRGKNRNPMVTYKYTVDQPRPGRARFHYRLSEWSPCSVTCGIGKIRRHLQCYDEHERLVEQAQCYHIEPPRNEAMMEQCRMPACRAMPEPQTHWWVGGWMPCSRTCRMPGEEPTKQRSVYCVDKKQNSIVNVNACDALTRPISSIKCADVPPC